MENEETGSPESEPGDGHRTVGAATNDIANGPSRTERIFVRVSMWQTVLSVVGMLIGIIALYAALSESEAVRKQTAASVWPYLQLIVLDYAGEEGAGFSMSLSNAGVGPARLRSLEVEITGQPVRSWGQAVRRLIGDTDAEYGQNFVIGRVVTPGESVSMVHTTDPVLVAAFRKAAAEPASGVRFCYCSIFDDCWLRDSRLEGADPEAVDACPDFGEGAFGD